MWRPASSVADRLLWPIFPILVCMMIYVGSSEHPDLLFEVTPSAKLVNMYIAFHAMMLGFYGLNC